jgi:hypothetical protein
MEVLAQALGFSFIGIILICLIWTVMSYIFSNESMGTNDKLLDNMEKYDKKSYVESSKRNK